MPGNRPALQPPARDPRASPPPPVALSDSNWDSVMRETATSQRSGPRPGAVRVEVADADPVLPTPCRTEGLTERGRGLHLVATLAHRWGADPAPHGGKVVWFEATV